MTRASVVIERLVEIIGDYEWHDREEVIHELMPLVPPGRAYRWLESMRKSTWLRRHPGTEVPPRRRKHPSDRLIRMGQRSMVVNQISGFTRLEAQGDKIRLRPPQGLIGYRSEAERQRLLAERQTNRFSELPPEQRHAYLSQRAYKGWQTRRQRAADSGLPNAGHQPQEGTDN